MPEHRAIFGQVIENQAIFRAGLEADLLPEHRGSYALMSDGELVEVFDERARAKEVGFGRFPLGGFSIHPIGHPLLQSGYVQSGAPIPPRGGE